MRLKNRLSSFMYGRYGADELYRFLVIFAMVMLVAGAFAGLAFRLARQILQTLAIAALIIAFFRLLSRNTEARREENAAYLRASAGVRSWFRLIKNKRKNRKTSVYIKCPGCKNVLRLPRVSGTHTAKCPCCSHTFEVNIR
ncbi:MAG: hypothetical protein KBS59_06570 [Clostridiales bacterium]|nr:hypothetical protein [Clostridiales bacterium]